MNTKTREAIIARLDIRCVTWLFGVAYTQQRCNTCDGCVASRWVEDTVLTSA